MNVVEKRVRILSVCTMLVCVTFASISVAGDPPPPPLPESAPPTVPDGFIIQKVAGSPLVKFPMMAGFDDRGRLFIAESAGKNLRSHDLMKELPGFIRMIEDTDGDGVFDKSTIFADKMTLPQGALWYRGALFVGSPPSVWRLEDTDGDGIADKRKEIVNNFGFSGNAASVHGCFLGPNGRIYWCDGRHGHEFRDKNGKVTSGGLAARIFSCKPDGSDVQIYCAGGMDNPVEIDFMPSGEMFGTVNILLTKPRVDCLVHWLEGGAYPHYERATVELQKTGDLLQPTTKLGHVAVSGMTRYRSTHLGPDFQNNIFTTLFNTHKVIRSIVERSGATFRTRQEEFLVSHDPDFHPTDVLEDADGSLLVIDTGGWFRIGCPVSKVAKPDIHGAIYRIRRKGAPKVADSRGRKLKLKQKTPQQLIDYLDDPRPAVREQVVDLLAQTDSVDAILSGLLALQIPQGTSTAGDTDTARVKYVGTVESRRNAIWALSRIGTEPAIATIATGLSDKDESVRIAAARSLGHFRDSPKINRLSKLLAERVTTDSPAVRRQAAAALGRLLQPQLNIASTTALAASENIEARKRGERFQIAALVAASAKRPKLVTPKAINVALASLFAALPAASADRALEHALIFAVIRISDREQTIQYLTHSNPQIRRAALIALDQMHGGKLTRELVTPLLDTDDPELQKQALAVIGKHKGWATETLKLLHSWLMDSKLTDERIAVLRGFLLSQQNDREIQILVAEYLFVGMITPRMRLLLLEVIQRSTMEKLPGEWIGQIASSLHRPEPEVRLQALRIIQERKFKGFEERLTELANSEKESPELRVAALAALVPHLESLHARRFNFLRDRLGSNVEPLDRLAAARVLADSPLDGLQLTRLAAGLDDFGPLTLPVLIRAFSRTKDDKVGRALVASLKRSRATTNLPPDEFAAVIRNYSKDVQKSARVVLSRLGVDVEKQRAKLAELSALTEGGDAKKGRDVFFGKRAACASCHTVAAQGGKVGPDLTKIGGIRKGRDLLEAVALPSASFARGYRSYVIVTDQGRVHTGIISRQTADTVYLRTAELAEIRIPRNSIEAMRESNTSIMPKGLEKTLSKDELRDLLAFLQERK